MQLGGRQTYFATTTLSGQKCIVLVKWTSTKWSGLVTDSSTLLPYIGSVIVMGPKPDPSAVSVGELNIVAGATKDVGNLV